MKKSQKGLCFGMIFLVFTLLIINSSIAQTGLPTANNPYGAENVPGNTGITPIDISNEPYLYANYGQDTTGLMPWMSDYCQNSNLMDFIIEVPLDSCTPSVVRSDLLEEQNVPIFCKLTAVKINPLIEVPYIKSVSVNVDGKSQEVLGVTYYPPKTALGYYDYQYNQGANLVGEKGEVLGVPTLTDIGYVLIMLKQQPSESKMPENVKVNLTMNVIYSVARTYGLGESNFVLPLLDKAEWNSRYKEFSFWRGKGYIQLQELKENSAKIAIYSSPTKSPIGTVILNKGQQSSEIKLPGFYCDAGVQLRVDNISIPTNRALLLVDGSSLIVDNGEMIGDTGCSLIKLFTEEFGYGGSAEIRCQAKTERLQISNLQAELKIAKETSSRKILPGEKIIFQKPGTTNIEDQENWFVGYIGREYVTKDVSKNSGTTVTAQGIDDVIILVNLSKNMGDAEMKKIAKAIYEYVDLLHTSGSHLRNEEEIFEGITKANPAIKKNLGEAKNIKLIMKSYTSSYNIINGNEITLVSVSGPVQATYSKDVEDKYQAAINYYKEVSVKYPDLKSEKGEHYGITALKEASRLASDLNKGEDAIALLEEITNRYSNSDDLETIEEVEKVKNELMKKIQINGNNRVVISTLNGDHSFEVVKFIKPGLNDIFTQIKIDGVLGEYTLGDKIGKDSEWEITKIDDESVNFQYIYNTNYAGSVSSKDQMIYLNHPSLTTKEEDIQKNTAFYKPSISPGENSLKIEFVSAQIKREAKVTILPFDTTRQSATNFSIGIGIEKRAIQLNPDKTKSLISKLDSAISSIDSINSKIGKITSVWKKTCLAGATALWVKNFANTITGEGYARRKIMELYVTKCANKAYRNSLEQGKEVSITRCYQINEELINSDTKIMETALKQTNSFIENVKKGENVIRSSGLFGLTKTIDDEKFFANAQKIFPTDINAITFSKDEQTTTSSTFKNNLVEYQKYNLMFNSELKDYILEFYLKKACVGKENSLICTKEKENSVYEKLAKLETRLKEEQGKAEALNNMKDKVRNQIIPIYTLDKQIAVESETFEFTLTIAEKYGLNTPANYVGKYGTIVGWKTEHDKIIDCGVDNNQKPIKPNLKGTTYYLLVLGLSGRTSTGKANYNTEQIYLLSNENGDYKVNNYCGNIKEKPGAPSFDSNVAGLELSKCSGNVMDAKTFAEIKFWETGAYAGLISIMPIDRNSGYYLATKGPSVYETANNAWKANGDIQTYYICNVGPDKQISWTADGPAGDDVSCCIEISSQVNLNNLDSVPVVPGQENNANGKAESKRLIDLAKKCSKEAIQAYGSSSGSKKIKTTCNTYIIGQPVNQGGGTNCEEFMSPSDCRLMYNLCDPVMCPSSRCDYGGRYPVENVIQSGIIGSLLLCSPNFENGKGVIMPVCLTGLNAGLDALNSVLKSTKDCLNEQLTSGKTVGICDQIMSLYLCELMWKELDPFIKSGIPNIVQSTTQKGGGEYALFSESWQNSLDSARYFTNYYGVEVFKSFKARSTSQVSTEVCKKFASIAYPTQGQFFSELTQLDSPPQVFASFQEISTGGVNPESQYKVYYHIYAGKDSGVFYSVYLKNPSSQGYYSVPETYYVKDAYGYLNKDQYKSATPDFLAPSGYKEICIRINDKDICGFGQATTDFALDEAQNYYLESQLSQTITKSEDCVSGTSGIVSLSLNIQQSIESTTSPAIYKQGIVRVCSGTNPGGVDATRYVKVGYCDNTEMGCWLDTESVKNAISDTGIVNRTINTSIEKQIKEIMESGGYREKSDSITQLNTLETTYGALENIAEQKLTNYRNEMEKLYVTNEKGEIVKPKQEDLDRVSLELQQYYEFDRIKEGLIGLESSFIEERNKAFYEEERARADLSIARIKAIRAKITGAKDIFIAEKTIQSNLPIGISEIELQFSLFTYWPNKNLDVYKTYSDKNREIVLRLFTGTYEEYKDIFAVGPGTVVYSNYDSTFSSKSNVMKYSLILYHGNGVYSYYGNLVNLSDEKGNVISSPVGARAIVGQSFAANQKIGTSTGDFYFKTFLGNQASDSNLKNPLCFFDNSVLVKLTGVNDFVKSIGSTSNEEKLQKINEYKTKNCGFMQVAYENPVVISNCDKLGGQIVATCSDSNKILQFPITSGFQNRIDPFNYPGFSGYSSTYYPLRYKSIHRGIDIYANQGANVYSIADGEIIDDLGTCINIYHKNLDYTSIYCHIKKDSSIKKGDTVKIGQRIGTVDYPSAPHLHLTIYNGNRVNSAPYSSSYSLCGCNDDTSCDISKKLGCQTLIDDKYLIDPITIIPSNPNSYCCSEKTTTTEETKAKTKCSDYNIETECNSAKEGTTKCVWVQDLNDKKYKCSKCPSINQCSSDVKLPGTSGGLFGLGGNDRQFTQDECGSGKISNTICGLNCLWTSDNKCLNIGEGSATAEKICSSEKTPVINDPSKPEQKSCIVCPTDCTSTFASPVTNTAIPYFSTQDTCERAQIECPKLSCTWDTTNKKCIKKTTSAPVEDKLKLNEDISKFYELITADENNKYFSYLGVYASFEGITALSDTEIIAKINQKDTTVLNQLKGALQNWKTQIEDLDSRAKKTDAYTTYTLDSTFRSLLNIKDKIDVALNAIDLKISSGNSKLVSFNNEYYDLIKKYSSSDADTIVTEAVIYHESGGVYNAISPTGCVGPGQICYCTAWAYSDLSSPYCTELGYFKTGTNVFEKLTSCNCGTSCTPSTAKCTEENDDRFDKEKNVQVTSLHFKDQLNIFRDYYSQYNFAIAGYNAGSGLILAAIKATNKANPTWNEVSAKLTPELMWANGYSKEDWTRENLQKKIDNEIKPMVDSVIGYVEQLNKLNTQIT